MKVKEMPRLSYTYMVNGSNSGPSYPQILIKHIIKESQAFNSCSFVWIQRDGNPVVLESNNLQNKNKHKIEELKVRVKKY